MPALPESVSIASGGVVAGGRRRLPNYLLGAPLLTWVEAPSNRLTDIDPKNDPLINPNHPAAAPWNRTASGGVNVPSIDQVVRPWCGGVEHDGEFWLPLGAGHTDGADNAAYRIDLGVDNPAWSSPRPPSGALPLIAGGLPAGSTAQGNSFLLDDGQESSGVYADGRPRAIHSYRKHVFVPGLGIVMAVHGGTFSSATKSGKHTWLLDTETGEWEWKSTATSVFISESSGGAACYDSTRGCVYWLGGGTARLLRLNLETWTFASVSGDTIGSSGEECIVYVPELDIVVNINSYFSTKFCIRDPATGAITSPAVTGTAQSVGASTGVAWVPGIGLVFNVGSGGALWSLAPTGNPKTDPWHWSEISVTGTPPTSTVTGMFSKFGYSSRLKALYRIVQASEKPWLCRIG